MNNEDASNVIFAVTGQILLRSDKKIFRKEITEEVGTLPTTTFTRFPLENITKEYNISVIHVYGVIFP